MYAHNLRISTPFHEEDLDDGWARRAGTPRIEGERERDGTKTFKRGNDNFMRSAYGCPMRKSMKDGKFKYLKGLFDKLDNSIRRLYLEIQNS